MKLILNITIPQWNLTRIWYVVLEAQLYNWFGWRQFNTHNVNLDGAGYTTNYLVGDIRIYEGIGHAHYFSNKT